MIKVLLVMVFSLLSVVMSDRAEAVAGRVVGVSDGDTITLLINSRSEKVRLDGIDCPELGQAYGKKAKLFTSSRVYGKTVDLTRTGKDRYGRTLGLIEVDGILLNQALVQAGYAWHFKKYSSCRILDELEQEARRNCVGLWNDPHPVPPWEYRHPESKKISHTLPQGLFVIPVAAAAPKQMRSRIIYHGNVKSFKFHEPSCQHYNCKNCIAEFESREEAIQAGYVPCMICNP